MMNGNNGNTSGLINGNKYRFLFIFLIIF